MALATVTGALSDIGVAAFPTLSPRLIFTLSGPATEGTRVFATKPKVVPVNAGSGIFTVDLQTTTNLRPAAWYTITIEWLDPSGNYVAADFLEWKLFVPSGGGNLADLLETPVNPMLFWAGPTPPPNPQPGQYWLNTTTGILTKWS